jgi:hypothetical protein
MPDCWDYKYLIDNDGTKFVQDFKCNWFAVHKNQSAKTLMPQKIRMKGVSTLR